MRARRLRLAGCLVGLWAAVWAAAAEYPATLVLSNGDRLTGYVVRDEGPNLVFRSPIFGEITLPAGEARIEPAGAAPAAPPAQPAPAPAAPAAKPLPPAPAKPAPATPPGGSPQTGPETPAKPLWARLWDTLRLRGWASRISLGLRFEQGTPNEQIYNLRFETTRKIRAEEYWLDLAYDYADEERDGVARTKTDRANGNYRVRWQTSERFFVQSRTAAARDRLRQVDYDLEQSVGFGWRLWVDKKGQANVTPAVGGRAASNNLGASQNFIVTLFQDLRYRLLEQMQAVQEFSATVNATDTEDYDLRLVGRVETKITEKLNVDVRLEMDYDSLAAAGVDPLERRAIMAIAWRF